MKAIYFEYPSEYNEFFEKLSTKLLDIDITDNKKYWCHPFQENSFIEDDNKKMTKLRISLSPIISEYAITNEKEKEKMDLQIEEMWQDILNEDENIEEDKKIELLKLNNSDVWTGKTNEDLIADKINEIIKKLNKEE